MPKSLHLIHRDRKSRGDTRQQKPQPTLQEARSKLKLPYVSEHLREEDLQKALSTLPAK